MLKQPQINSAPWVALLFLSISPPWRSPGNPVASVQLQLSQASQWALNFSLLGHRWLTHPCKEVQKAECELWSGNLQLSRKKITSVSKTQLHSEPTRHLKSHYYLRLSMSQARNSQGEGHTITTPVYLDSGKESVSRPELSVRQRPRR